MSLLTLFSKKSPTSLNGNNDFDLANLIIQSGSKNLAGGQAALTDFAISRDGTYMITLDGGADYLYEWTLNIAWDITTAVPTGNSYFIQVQESTGRYIYIHPEGSSIYLVGRNSLSIMQFRLSIPYDLSTATYNSADQIFHQEVYDVISLDFNYDGSRIWITTTTNEIAYWDLATAWEITTAGSKVLHVSNLLTTAGYPDDLNAVGALKIVNNGTRAILRDATAGHHIQLDLSVPYDFSTAVYNGITYSWATDLGTVIPGAIRWWKNEGDIVLLGGNDNTIREYSITP